MSRSCVSSPVTIRRVLVKTLPAAEAGDSRPGGSAAQFVGVIGQDMSRKTSSERTAPSSLTAGVCEGRRVLVVDPDADTRALYREALRMEGCDVVEAADGRDALTKALVWPPAIVITELRLPLLSGFALCEILRRDRLTATVPIVVITGEARGAELERVHRIGANGVIVKPTTPDVLLSAVRRLLSVRQRPNETIANSFAPTRQGGSKRMALTKLHQRCATTTPPESPPSLMCPSCDRPLVYVQSHIGGVSSKHPEQWDDFACPSCGRFEYRHRTRKLRRVQ
jgi:CheY-like chemotaxis protein